ncbi:hypothetical protein, partial [Escherichia coli]|uniref:hypothetical protein n=1 Tax=Escherichia coli TaxID=562 RepID=UPI001BFCAB82
TDFGGKTSIFSHPVYLFLREFSLQDFRGGSVAVPAGQCLLMPDSSITTPSSTTITTTPVERPVTLDGMAVDAIPQVHPVTQDHAVTKAVV